ncbi:MAG: hypothetical protein ACUVUC_02245 [Thermoguttaceae bacterium]
MSVRNRSLATLLGYFVLGWSFAQPSGAGPWSKPGAGPRQSHSLEVGRRPGSLDRVEVLLEVDGHLKIPDLKASGPGKTTPVKMRATGKLDYEEKTLEAPAAGQGPLRSIRYYDKAEAVIRVGQDEFRPSLRDQRRLIAAQLEGSAVTLFHPSGLLTREELDLIDLLGNSLLLDRLMPERPVALNGTWRHPDALMAGLLGLDAVNSNDVESVLRLVSGGEARIEISGHVGGSVNGVSTSIELKGKYRFDLKRGRVMWLALALQEDRGAGPIGPGLEVQARLEVKVSPLQQPVHLTEAMLADLKAVATAELKRLYYGPAQGGWELAYDRRWVVIQDRPETVLLRMVDRGEYLGQCTIVSGRRPEGAKELTLAEFQDDIRRALGASFGRVVGATESGEGDRRVYRVVVVGEAAQVPIQWIYYRLADPSGRQVILAFTVKRELAERFEPADQDLTRALRFVDATMAAKPAVLGPDEPPRKPEPLEEPEAGGKGAGSGGDGRRPGSG